MPTINDFQNEIWKDVIGYEGQYKVSNLGRIKSYTLNQGGKLLSLTIARTGYPYVCIVRNGSKANKYVHRMVAMAFIDNPANLPQVNHKNGIKSDNSKENLEWVTRSENVLHAYRTGLIDLSKCTAAKKKAVGKLNPHAKKVAQYTKDNTLVKVWDCQMDAARSLGVNHKHISGNVNGNHATAFGFIWKRVN